MYMHVFCVLAMNTTDNNGNADYEGNDDDDDALIICALYVLMCAWKSATIRGQWQGFTGLNEPSG